jgi:hypothetical protein
MKIVLLVLLLCFTNGLIAQRIALPDLFGMMEWPHHRIDTTLKKQGYLLMQKEIDSVTSIYQYSHLDRNEKKPTTVRSFAYMDVKSGDLRSRLVNYRTYSQEEYVAIATWLLENGYQTKEKYDFGEQKHTVYTNGKETLRVKVITTKLDEGKEFTSWEVEIGK